MLGYSLRHTGRARGKTRGQEARATPGCSLQALGHWGVPWGSGPSLPDPPSCCHACVCICPPPPGCLPCASEADGVQASRLSPHQPACPMASALPAACRLTSRDHGAGSPHHRSPPPLPGLPPQPGVSPARLTRAWAVLGAGTPRPGGVAGSPEVTSG